MCWGWCLEAGLQLGNHSNTQVRGLKPEVEQLQREWKGRDLFKVIL